MSESSRNLRKVNVAALFRLGSLRPAQSLSHQRMIGDLADRVLCELRDPVSQIKPRLCHRWQARFLGENGITFGEIKAASCKAPVLRFLFFATHRSDA